MAFQRVFTFFLAILGLHVWIELIDCLEVWMIDLTKCFIAIGQQSLIGAVMRSPIQILLVYGYSDKQVCIVYTCARNVKSTFHRHIVATACFISNR